MVYDSATSTYAGSEGTEANCDAVLDALGVPAGAINAINCGSAIDCYYEVSQGDRTWCIPLGDEGNSFSTAERACACMP